MYRVAHGSSIAAKKIARGVPGRGLEVGSVKMKEPDFQSGSGYF